MSKYPKEVSDFIVENVNGTTTRELIELVNTTFGTNFTESKMKSFKSNHGLKSGTPCGLPKGSITDAYSQQIRDYISENYLGTGPTDMSKLLNKTFGTSYTAGQLKGYYANHDLDSGLKGYFPKGNIPFNKGTHIGGWEPTQFKKGSIPPNRLPIGSERIDSKDGYTYVKIQDGHLNKNWKLKHVLIWEEQNGPVPKGHNVIFGDRDNSNFDINNLIMVSKQQMLLLNRHKLIQNDAELSRTGVIIADLIAKTNQRKRGSQ